MSWGRWEMVWSLGSLGGELVVVGGQSLVLTEAWALQKAESEELEVQKPQVKLRRTVSEVARPASTPPIMASAIKDEDDEDRIIAELEVGQGHTWPRSHHLDPATFPCHADPVAGG